MDLFWGSGICKLRTVCPRKSSRKGGVSRIFLVSRLSHFGGIARNKPDLEYVTLGPFHSPDFWMQATVMVGCYHTGRFRSDHRSRGLLRYRFLGFYPGSARVVLFTPCNRDCLELIHARYGEAPFLYRVSGALRFGRWWGAGKPVVSCYPKSTYAGAR